MFADNTLTPKEAVRLCALGTVASAPLHYSELAGSVRHFISRIMGPSLDLMGTSIELLRYEGLIEALDGKGMEDNAVLAITEAGRQELHTLLTARLRSGTDLTKLVVALKFRFMHLLNEEDRQAQADQLLDSSETELARLLDLRQHHVRETNAQTGDPLLDWLDHEIDQLERRLQWLEKFRASL
ncbi:hypothetical protein [Telmatospirillum sp. J64-1]|uniref:hypothetical protein n=1 Tax=Telmatospirillum sp. J64-1 TaxID=2502183 RepID=UPI00115D2089|nr:hypothetical protein [Telmatospirillum sp. J64-1]